MSDSNIDICKCGDYRRQHIDGSGKCKICSSNNLPGPCHKFEIASKLSDVYEVYGGKTASASGWDFTVCRTMQELQDIISSDADDLKEGDALKIIYRRYTQDQLDEVE